MLMHACVNAFIPMHNACQPLALWSRERSNLLKRKPKRESWHWAHEGRLGTQEHEGLGPYRVHELVILTFLRLESVSAQDGGSGSPRELAGTAVQLIGGLRSIAAAEGFDSFLLLLSLLDAIKPRPNLLGEPRNLGEDSLFPHSFRR